MAVYGLRVTSNTGKRVMDTSVRAGLIYATVKTNKVAGYFDVPVGITGTVYGAVGDMQYDAAYQFGPNVYVSGRRVSWNYAGLPSWGSPAQAEVVIGVY